MNTKCRKCGGQLYLLSAIVLLSHVMIHEDGFDLYSGKRCDTTDEKVVCEDCNHVDDLTHEDEHVN